ncbi:M48 family metalloprotease [Solicola gregarius]|uniref:M48 family metalloprotease n=1 Tax=Solicola gregarius TaxID=2908642 RepID=A0AA46YLE3_9ACTN|nr:M48 family metalloprotease [Solicola gregarius]UYM05426.1 M48 family metalloprotease [Solicola gregarius]
MPTTRFRSDPQLTARMVCVVVLVIAFHAVVFAYLAYASDVVMAAVLIGGALLAQWWFGDRAALKALGARTVTAEEQPELHGVVDRLCALADRPKPTVAIAEQPYANAFAVGRSPRHATVCVTTTLLDVLDGDELEAVIAHELAHIAHRDVVVMTGAASFRLLFEAAGRRVQDQDAEGDDGKRPATGPGATQQRSKFRWWMIVFWLYALVYYISGLLGSALSRYRELSADRSASYLTGNPTALASALTKLSGGSEQIPDRDLRAVGSVGEMMFVPMRQVGYLRSKFQTHPPVSERLDALADVAADLGRPLG